MRSRSHQRGYLLVTVIVTLFMVASVAVLLSHDSSISANTSNRELETARAEYVARAGMQHALWRVENNACMGDFTVPATTLGADSYDAVITGAAAGTFHTLSADQDAWIRDDQPDNNNNSTESHIRYEGGNTEHALTRFDVSSLTANAQINSAIAWFYVKDGVGEHPEGPLTVHRMTADWTETGATWDTVGGRFENGALATVPAQAQPGRWVSFNITGQVQAWVNGQPNYGILMASTAEGVHAQYDSREGANPPRLEVVVGSGAATPVTLKATGTLDSGVSRTVERVNVPVFNAAWPSTIAIQPGPEGKDSFIEADPGHHTHNKGDDKDLKTDSETGKEYRSLLQFDLADIPVGARIVSAELQLYLDSSAGAAYDVEVHPVTRSWSETGVTWISRDGFNDWDNPGGDYEAASAGSFTAGTTGFVTVDITTLTRDWLDGTTENHGLMLLSQSAAGNNEKVYVSSDDDADPSLRPKLEIGYACECGKPCLAPHGSGTVMLVIGNVFLPTGGDKARREAFESWGYDVNYYDDDTWQSLFDSGFGSHDAVYVSESSSATKLGDKLTSAPIGVVSEVGELNDNFGIASGFAHAVGRNALVVDTSHFITSVFPGGAVDVYEHDMEHLSASGTVSATAQVLATMGTAAALVAMDGGAIMPGGGTTAGRRVMVPPGTGGNFNWDYLNDIGRLLVQRSLAWSMNADGSMGAVLMVVGNDGGLTDQENAKKALIESWGFSVSVIDEDDNQSQFDGAFAQNDVVFVSEDVNANDINTKLTGATIGVVSEEASLAGDLGLAEGIGWASGTEIEINLNTHYITQDFSVGPLTVLNTAESIYYLTPDLAPGLDYLGRYVTQLSLTSIDTGGSLQGGGSAAGRRVMLPWGGNNMDVSYLTADGLTIFRRALQWGAGAERDNSPIAHWKLDDWTGTAALDSAGGHDGTLTYGPSWSAGQLDGALTFDGSNDFVNVAHDDALWLTNEMTFTAWANTIDTSSGYKAIIAKDTPGNGLSNYWFGIENNELVFGFWAGGIFRTVTTAGANLAPNSWHHLAASFDNVADVVRLYVDGVEAQFASFVYEPTTESADLWIGKSPDGEFWDGALDDVRIYDRVLSAEEIAELATLPGPFAHWKLDETSGTTAVDSESGHDGTLVNGPAWTSGSLDGGLMFDGNDDHVVIAHNESLSISQSITVSAWVNSTNLNMYDLVLSKGNNSSTYAYYFGTVDDEIVFGFKDASFHDFATSGLNLGTDTWHHIAATYSNGGDRIVLYHNGVEVHSASTTLDLPVNANDLYMGTSENGADWNGILDDVRIYDRVLTADEIAELALPDGPIAHWKLDDGTGLTAVDSEGGHDGTLANGPVWVAGQLGDALEFDGGTAYVDLTSDSALDDVFVGGATVTAWIRPYDWGDNGYGRILDKSSSPSSTGDGWVIRMNKDNGGIINFGQGFTGGRGWWKIPNGSISLDTWQHVAIAYDADDTANDPVIYLGGSSIAVTRVDTPSGSIRSDAAINLRLGNHAGGTSHTFKGVIDDVRIYDRVLDASEVAAVAAEGSFMGGGGGGGGDCDGTFRDEFNAQSFSGSNGTLSWAGQWVEVGESNGATSGDIRVMTDQSNYQLRTRDNDNGGEGVEREADLSGASSATLSYDYRRMNLDSTSDYTSVEVSANGAAGPWRELTRHDGSGNDSNYVSASHDISAEISSNTRIRFKTSSSMGGTDTVWFDNVQITCTP